MIFHDNDRCPLPQTRQIPDLDDSVLAHCQDSLLFLLDVDEGDRVLCVEESRERGTIGVLKCRVASVADANVVFEAHYWNVDLVWRAFITNGLAAVSEDERNCKEFERI